MANNVSHDSKLKNINAERIILNDKIIHNIVSNNKNDQNNHIYIYIYTHTKK